LHGYGDPDIIYCNALNFFNNILENNKARPRGVAFSLGVNVPVSHGCSTTSIGVREAND
jgi:hypothetical protein